MMPTELISDTSHSGGKKRILNRVLRRTLSSPPGWPQDSRFASADLMPGNAFSTE